MSNPVQMLIEKLLMTITTKSKINNTLPELLLIICVVVGIRARQPNS